MVLHILTDKEACSRTTPDQGARRGHACLDVLMRNVKGAALEPLINYQL